MVPTPLRKVLVYGYDENSSERDGEPTIANRTSASGTADYTQRAKARECV